MTITLDLMPELDRLLALHAERMGQSKSAFAEHAIAEFIEDIEDSLAAEAALKDFDPNDTFSLNEVRERLGLDLEDQPKGTPPAREDRNADLGSHSVNNGRYRAA